MNINSVLLSNRHNIDFIESAGNYIIINYRGIQKKTVIRYRIGDVEKEAIDDNLLRIHNRYIVNMLRSMKIIRAGRSYKLKLNNTEHLLPISRKYLIEVKRRLQQVSLQSEAIYTRNDPGYPF